MPTTFLLTRRDTRVIRTRPSAAVRVRMCGVLMRIFQRECSQRKARRDYA